MRKGGSIFEKIGKRQEFLPFSLSFRLTERRKDIIIKLLKRKSLKKDIPERIPVSWYTQSFQS